MYRGSILEDILVKMEAAMGGVRLMSGIAIKHDGMEHGVKGYGCRGVIGDSSTISVEPSLLTLSAWLGCVSRDA